MHSWIETSIGNLVDIKHGFAFKGEFFCEEPPGDVLITPGNFAIGGGFKADKFKYYLGPVPEEFVLSEGDLIVTMTDLSKESDTLGYPAIVPPHNENHRYLHNQRLGKVVLRERDTADYQFLYYLLCSREYRYEVLASATGTTVKHTSPDRIKQFKFWLPPLPEQRAIANILGTLDDKIELNRQMNQTLEAITQTLFKSWFVDFDPVRAKMEGLDTDLPQEVLRLFPDSLQESELGMIPTGWKVCRLDEIATYLNGLALQKYPPDGHCDLPVIKIAQLRAGHVEGAALANCNVPSDYIVDDGDVLFSWSGSLEVQIWCGGKGALNQHLFKVTSKVFPKWFYYLWTSHHLPQFRDIAADKATTMGHIQRRHLSEALVLVPPVSLIKAIDEQIGPLVDRMIACRIESRSLAQIRDTLLPKLLSGELSVKEAEVAMEVR